MFYLTVSVWGSPKLLKEASETFGRVKLARFFVTYPYLVYGKPTLNRVISELRQSAEKVTFALDSGGFVQRVKLNRSKPEPTLINYACFLRQHGDLFDFCLSWDFGDPTACYEAFQFLRKQDLRVVPVWHLGEPIDLLKDYCRLSELVAIGGFGALGRHNAKMELLFSLVAGHLIELNERFGTMFHGLGVGFNETLLRLWLPNSADSTTPIQCQRYGYLVYPDRDGLIKRKWFRELTQDDLPVPLNDFLTNSRLRSLVVSHMALKTTEILNLKGWSVMQIAKG